jgi:hypothetical protein
MAGELYYLSSLESLRLAPVRECRFERSLTFDTGKPAVQASLVPGVIGQDLNRGPDIDTVVLAARHEGFGIDPVTEVPCFVFVAVARSESDVLESPIRSDDLIIIGWGELYRTRDDAERQLFGGR